MPRITSGRARGSESGSMLEQALVLPVLLGVVLAAIDISRMLQAYAVMEQGMRSALRCVYPANGACVQAAAPGSEPLFDVFERTPQYIIQQFHYSADAEWLRIPAFESSAARAAVLRDVRYDLPAFQRRFERDLFSVSGQAFYLSRTQGFPRIQAQSFDPFVPRVVAGADSTDPTLLPVVDRALSSQLLRLSANPALRPEIRRLAVDFRVPRPADAALLRSGEMCYTAPSASTDPAAWSQCNTAADFGSNWNGTIRDRINDHFGIGSSPSELSDYTFIVIDVRADSSAPAGSRGEVAVRMTHDGRTYNLGGRIFDSRSGGNLVPRGAPASHYDGDIIRRYGAEVADHQSLLVKYDTTIRLTFELQGAAPAAGDIVWDPVRIRVYAPAYRLESAIAPCRTPAGEPLHVSASQPVAPDQCFTAYGGTARTAQADLSSPVRVEVRDLCAERSTASTEAVLTAAGVRYAADYREISAGSGAECGRRAAAPQLCPANFGVADRSTIEQGEAVIRGSAAAQAICPPAEEVRATAENVHWTEIVAPIPDAPPVRWELSSCSKSGPDSAEIPAALARYPKLQLEHGTTAVSYRNLPTAELPAAEFQQAHPEYGCPAIQTEHRRLDAANAELKSESLFKYHSDLGADFERRLRDDAMRQHIDPARNIPSGVYFKAAQQLVEVRASAPPAASEMSYWLDPDAPAAWLRTRSGIPRRDIPAVCAVASAECRYEYSGSRPSDSAASEPILADFAAAASRGYEAVEAAMPALSRGCAGRRGESCADLTVSADPADPLQFTARASVRFPLLILPGEFRASRIARERWEGSFVRE